jgi:hypothetical protein
MKEGERGEELIVESINNRFGRRGRSYVLC